MSTLESQGLGLLTVIVSILQKKKKDPDLREVIGLLPGFIDNHKSTPNVDVCVPSLSPFPRELPSKERFANQVLTLGT